MSILRYPVDEVVTSTQNGFVDLTDWLGFLCAKDYLLDVLVKVHGFTASDAKRRVMQIVPHVRIAIGYIEQSLEGPRDLAFLPAYYAILNLSKVYVLLAHRHAALSGQRWHGASYDVERKDSRNVLTEVITLHSKGVFPLFHETLTGHPFKAKRVNIEMKAILPCVAGIGHEYALATGSRTKLCTLEFGLTGSPDGKSLATVSVRDVAIAGAPPSAGRTSRIVPCLMGFTPRPWLTTGQLVGDVISNPLNYTNELRNQLRTHLIFRRHDFTYTLLGPNKIEFPEEVPIWLLFFYMSSIVRYKPEFFSRLRDSKYWPQLAAARLHAFLDFLLAFWSFVHRKNYFLVGP
jgi:hypothetical protein